VGRPDDQVVRVSPDWLELREPADAAARSVELAQVLAQRLADPAVCEPADEQTRRLVVHDLGAGTGSMARWLGPRLPGPQRWVLHDRDADLSRQALIDRPLTGSGDPASLDIRIEDITRLGPSGLAGADLITASALLDMLTTEELQRVIRSCAVARCPVLFSLTVTGSIDMDPAHSLDPELVSAFNDHQRRPARGGTLLGPDAGDTAAAELTDVGYDVWTASSPWQLAGDERRLIAAWLAGWVTAAVEQRPYLALAAEDYLATRGRQIADDALAVSIGHIDILAVPGGGS
jgi:hypothetical protein